MNNNSLITFNENGIWCPIANVYIDPWKPVKKALITHGHSDHARYGSNAYIATHQSVPIIKFRLGSHIDIKGVKYGEEININGVKFSFTPAGHIIGSAQIKVEYKGEIWVVSGDYKLEDDGLSGVYEPIKCHHFITESTFGLPAFKWQPQSMIMDEINHWWRKNNEEGIVSVIAAYSLGKAQRIINNVDHSIGEIYTHGAVENTNEILRKQGEKIHKTTRIIQGMKPSIFDGSLVIAPPSAVDSNWSKRFKTQSNAIASGWMGIRGTRRRRSVDRGFILSDHADWDQLNEAVNLTGAENIYVTHGYTDIYSKYLNEKGYNAQVVKTQYTGETADLEIEKA